MSYEEADTSNIDEDKVVLKVMKERQSVEIRRKKIKTVLSTRRESLLDQNRDYLSDQTREYLNNSIVSSYKKMIEEQFSVASEVSEDMFFKELLLISQINFCNQIDFQQLTYSLSLVIHFLKYNTPNKFSINSQCLDSLYQITSLFINEKCVQNFILSLLSMELIASLALFLLNSQEFTKEVIPVLIPYTSSDIVELQANAFQAIRLLLISEKDSAHYVINQCQIDEICIVQLNHIINNFQSKKICMNSYNQERILNELIAEIIYVVNLTLRRIVEMKIQMKDNESEQKQIITIIHCACLIIDNQKTLFQQSVQCGLETLFILLKQFSSITIKQILEQKLQLSRLNEILLDKSKYNENGIEAVIKILNEISCTQYSNLIASHIDLQVLLDLLTSQKNLNNLRVIRTLFNISIENQITLQSLLFNALFWEQSVLLMTYSFNMNVLHEMMELISLLGEELIIKYKTYQNNDPFNLLQQIIHMYSKIISRKECSKEIALMKLTQMIDLASDLNPMLRQMILRECQNQGLEVIVENLLNQIDSNNDSNNQLFLASSEFLDRMKIQMSEVLMNSNDNIEKSQPQSQEVGKDIWFDNLFE